MSGYSEFVESMIIGEKFPERFLIAMTEELGELAGIHKRELRGDIDPDNFIAEVEVTDLSALDTEIFTQENSKIKDNTLITKFHTYSIEGNTIYFHNTKSKVGTIRTPLNKEKVLLELGDLFFYFTAYMNTLGIDIFDVINGNRLKLEDRKKRKVLQGKGDNR